MSGRINRMDGGKPGRRGKPGCEFCTTLTTIDSGQDKVRSESGELIIINLMSGGRCGITWWHK